MNMVYDIRNIVQNIPGWHTNRHFIIIESDDWGSIRMPSMDVYSKLITNGIQLGKYGYEKVDTLASKEDLDYLFELCLSFKDINGNPLVITANAVVGNPDFDKIRESEFLEYFWEPVDITMNRYYGSESPLVTWHRGMDAKVFHPQLHGREHVNVPMWLNTLKADYPGARFAFENGVFSILVDKEFDSRVKNTSALRYNGEDDFKIVEASIMEASSKFIELFGYKSESFIAPSFSWDRQIENVLSSVGVKYLQGMAMHFYNGKRTLNYIGRTNIQGQIYLNRNVDFELTQNPNRDNVDLALSQIATAFKWHKPATISMHRLNFIGVLDKKNRDANLKQMQVLFMKIQQRWPDVEFITSDQLGRLIESK